jgi:hypothetical protein
MVDIKDIPAEDRWKIATKAANTRTVVSDMLVRQIIGDKIDDIWEVIYSKGGQGSKAIAESFKLPASNAIEVNDAFIIAATIILGPELKADVLEANEDRVIGKVLYCPLLNANRNVGSPTKNSHSHCLAYCQNSVESLNPHYTLSNSKRMCLGDPYCEYAIELKK